jgi:hypothetical protein
VWLIGDGDVDLEHVAIDRSRPSVCRSVWWNTRRSARLVAVESTPDDVGGISELPDLPEQIDRSTPTLLR